MDVQELGERLKEYDADEPVIVRISITEGMEIKKAIAYGLYIEAEVVGTYDECDAIVLANV